MGQMHYALVDLVGFLRRNARFSHEFVRLQSRCFRSGLNGRSSKNGLQRVATAAAPMTRPKIGAKLVAPAAEPARSAASRLEPVMLPR